MIKAYFYDKFPYFYVKNDNCHIFRKMESAAISPILFFLLPILKSDFAYLQLIKLYL